MADDTPFDPPLPADLPPRKRGPKYPFDPDPNEDQGAFEQLWQDRGGGPAASAEASIAQEGKEKVADLRGVAGEPKMQWYDPSRGQSPEQAGRWRDERGLTGDELDLQARYLHGKGEYGDFPIPRAPWRHNPGYYRPEDVPEGTLDPRMGGDLPSGHITPDVARHYNVQHNLKGQFSPNTTPLDDTNDFIKYLQWAKAGGKNILDEEHDYDLRGYYKAGGQLATPGGNPVHLPDTFKKPNHPTFSDESKYSGPGNEGGHWIKDKQGNYIGFQAGPANLQYHTPEDMQAYFSKYEPGLKLSFPPGTEGVPSSFEDRFPRGAVMEAPQARKEKK